MTEEYNLPSHANDDCMKYVVGYVVIAVLFCFSIFLIALIVILTIYPVPWGPSPSFTLQDVKIYALNLSTTASTLTSTLQITILCNNNNESFQLDNFYVYATYRNRHITLPTLIPPTHVGRPETVVWSSTLNGTEVSLNPYLVASLEQDLLAGELLINVKATGWMRSKELFPLRSRLKVDCLAYVTLKDKINDDNVIGNLVGEYPFEGECRVGVKIKGYF